MRRGGLAVLACWLGVAGCASGPPEDRRDRPRIVEEERRANQDVDGEARSAERAMSTAEDRASAEAREVRRKDLEKVYEDEFKKAGGNPDEAED